MNGHILVVDDEEEIRKALSRHFRYLGFEVDEACNGKEAIDFLAKARIDILITDIVMPVMNGVDLLRTVRKEYPMMRVIVITGYVTQEYVLACMRHGAETCIFKPWPDLVELEKAVKKSVTNLKMWKKKLHQRLEMQPNGQEA